MTDDKVGEGGGWLSGGAVKNCFLVYCREMQIHKLAVMLSLFIAERHIKRKHFSRLWRLAPSLMF